VKRHAWFSGFDFQALVEGKLAAPVTVELPGGRGDTSNFDRYAEAEEALKGKCRSRWRGLIGGGGGGGKRAGGGIARLRSGAAAAGWGAAG
jgi:hypothetical protein